ncbi:MAG: hypothetical protein M9890_13890 [Thermomicrobiales bacterium]|nr:hypothetical protein [Thermomicrobiales bacterium]
MSKQFNPREHLRQLEDGSPYLDVKWRIHWLRSEHPEAEIETELLTLDDEYAVCKAVVRIPQRGAASGHARSASSQTPAYIETAETRAIGRALAALGYGTEFVEADVPGNRAAEPEPATIPSAQIAPVRTDEPEEASAEVSEPTQMRSLRESEPPRERSRREQSPREQSQREQQRPRAVPQPEQTVAQIAEDLPTPMLRGSDLRARDSAARGDPADVSWTRFWQWAKGRGYRDAQHLKDLLGIDVNALTPSEVRAHVARYEEQHGLPNEPAEE